MLFSQSRKVHCVWLDSYTTKTVMLIVHSTEVSTIFFRNVLPILIEHSLKLIIQIFYAHGNSTFYHRTFQ